MALLLSSWLSELVLVLAGGLVVLYLWFSHRYTYWTKKGVPQLEPKIPFGNIWDNLLNRKTLGEVMKDVYNQLKGHRFGGIYGFANPIFIVRDPDLIRQILVKDFSTFTDRGVFPGDDKPINRHLFSLMGQKWRRLRVKLTPTFTSGKLKSMFSTIDACGRELVEVMEEKAQRGEVVEMREVAACFTTDIVASVAFGIECHSLRDPEAEFRRWGREFFRPTLRQGFQTLLTVACPWIKEKFNITDGKEEVLDYFSHSVRQTVDYREKNNVSRKDFLQLLIQLKNKGALDDDKGSKDAADNWKLSMDDVTAQSFLFYIAGFETSSTTTSFTLMELSLHPEIQRKVQEEIDAVLQKHGGAVTYDGINEMSYLHKVVSETLRKYPVLPILNRECSEKYHVPDSDVVLDKGTAVVIPLLGIQKDPEYYPDPERFDPERFSEEENAKRHPYVYMPFGEGPRICIGMRMGLLQSKVGLVHLLAKFNVLPTKTVKTPVEFNTQSILLTSNHGIQLQLQKRT